MHNLFIFFGGKGSPSVRSNDLQIVQRVKEQKLSNILKNVGPIELVSKDFLTHWHLFPEAVSKLGRGYPGKSLFDATKI
jgi:hypothetical protein